MQISKKQIIDNLKSMIQAIIMALILILTAIGIITVMDEFHVQRGWTYLVILIDFVVIIVHELRLLTDWK